MIKKFCDFCNKEITVHSGVIELLPFNHKSNKYDACDGCMQSLMESFKDRTERVRMIDA
jgi:hypothetical protein